MSALFHTFVSFTMFISHIHVRFLSCVVSLIVLPTLPSPSSAVLLKVSNEATRDLMVPFTKRSFQITVGTLAL